MIFKKKYLSILREMTPSISRAAVFVIPWQYNGYSMIVKCDHDLCMMKMVLMMMMVMIMMMLPGKDTNYSNDGASLL